MYFFFFNFFTKEDGTKIRRRMIDSRASKWPDELTRVNLAWGFFGPGKLEEPEGKVGNQTSPKCHRDVTIIL
jgi:hypothetical protein